MKSEHKLTATTIRRLLRSLLVRTRLDPSTGCWLLPASGGNGYPVVRTGPTRNEGTMQAHRAMYIAIWGPLPKGYYVGHRCDCRSCVNPMHLYACTPKENAAAVRLRGEMSGIRLYSKFSAGQTRILTRHGVRFRKDILRSIQLASEPKFGSPGQYQKKG